jgi:hypothetical protein
LRSASPESRVAISRLLEGAVSVAR